MQKRSLSVKRWADPYADVFWGILTGYDAANALVIAREREPLVIKRVASGAELAMDRIAGDYRQLRAHSQSQDLRSEQELSRGVQGDFRHTLICLKQQSAADQKELSIENSTT